MNAEEKKQLAAFMKLIVEIINIDHPMYSRDREKFEKVVEFFSTPD